METAENTTTSDLRRYAVSQGNRAASWTRPQLETCWTDGHSDDGEKQDNAMDIVTDNDASQAAKRAAIELLLGGGGKAQSGVTEARIIELVREHSIGVQTVVVKRLDGTSSIPDIAHKQFQDVLDIVNAQQRQPSGACGGPAYLVGPAGSGKTFMAEQIAESLGLPFYYVGAISDRYMDYLGFYNTAGEYQRTPFRDAWENGGVMLFDEFDGSFANEVLPLNASLAGAKTMAFPDGMIAKHDNFRVIIAANTYGKGADRQYVGRFQLDAATLNRFAVIDLEYDEPLETAIAGNIEWTEYVQRVRAIVIKLDIRHVVSPRASINGAIYLAQGMKRGKVADMVLWQGLSNTEQKRVKAEL